MIYILLDEEIKEEEIYGEQENNKLGNNSLETVHMDITDGEAFTENEVATEHNSNSK